MDRLTTDVFLDGRLKITQDRCGYRFSLDAVLLAAETEPKAGDTLIDLGAGCGIIPLIIAFRHPEVHIRAVEMQYDLAELSRGNVIANRMQEQIKVIRHDMRTLSVDDVDGPADWIVSNPPYYRSHSGRINPNVQRALARHEINLNLSQLLQTVRRLLRTGGRFGIIYPSERAVDLFCEMRQVGIEPKRMRLIHSREKDEAKLILVQGVQGGNPGMTIATPLVVYDSNGVYTSEVNHMISS